MKKNQGQIIYRELENDIISGKYQPNDKLPGIPDLTKKYHVSYGTAHSVISKLAENRLVVIEHGRGTYVLGDRPLGIEWLWFVGGTSINDELFDSTIEFLKSFWHSGRAKKITLNINFLDVRNLPSPVSLANAARERGIRGFLVCGHGTFFLDYVDTLSTHIPVVSLFGHWEGRNFSFVEPDAVTVIDEFFDIWNGAGAKSVGFLSLPLENHPNYMRLYKVMQDSARKHNLAMDGQSCFLNSDYDASLNWAIGKLSRGNAPQHWVTSIPGHARSLLAAADTIGLKPGKDIHILTFSMLSSDYESFEEKISFGIQQFEPTVEAGINRLLENIWGKKGDTDEKAVCVPMKILRDIQS